MARRERAAHAPRVAAPRRGDPARLRARSSCCCSAGSGSARRSAISSPARWSGRTCSAWSAAPRRCCDIAEIGIVLLLFLVGLELNPARLWRLRHEFSASACSRSCSAGSPSSALVWLATGFVARRRARARPAAGAVLDRAGAADAAVGRAAAHAVRRARLLDPAVPGPVDRAADHHRRGDVAATRPMPAAPPGWQLGALHGRRDRRAGRSPAAS